MAITYQSIQSNTASSGTTVVVTKPTSLAVGDLMLAQFVVSNNNTVTLPSGFTAIHNVTFNGNTRRFCSSYKVADSGDVAASNFTFTSGGTIGAATASIMRFTTTASFPSSPVLDSNNQNVATSTTTPSFTLALSTGPATSFLIAHYYTSANITSSAQASTVSRTWTERNDYNSTSLSASVATAPNTEVGSLTAFTLTSSGTHSDHNISFLVIAETDSETADVSHLAVTPTVSGVTASEVTVTADVSHSAITPTLNGIPTDNTSDRAQWTNETLPTTTWTNETL